MKHTFKALLLVGVFYLIPVLSGNNLLAQNNLHADFEGSWIFEKAEYLERPLPQMDYEVKQIIKDVGDLFAFGDCYQNVVTRIDVFNENSAYFFCLYDTFDGTYYFPNNLPDAYGRQVRFIYGEPENEDIPVDDPAAEAERMKRVELKPKAPTTECLFEFIDKHTIGIILERPCWENGAMKVGAIRCILKRDLGQNNH